MTASRKLQRSGFSFAELILSIALISLLFGLVAQINVTISNAVLRNELHLAASEELDNMIEQIAAFPYDQITAETATNADLVRSENRIASWTFSLIATETTDGIVTKRIEVALTSPKTQRIRVKRVFWKTKPIDERKLEDAA